MHAEEAAVTRCGVHGRHAVAHAKRRHALAHRSHGARDLMPEEHGRLEHGGMVAAAKDLEIRAAGERGAHLEQQLARPGRRHSYLLQPQVFPAVKNGGHHGGNTHSIAIFSPARLNWEERTGKGVHLIE